MAKGLKGKIKGDTQLIAKLRGMGSAMRGRALAGAAMAGIKPIENTMAGAAPFLSGTLRRSIHSELIESSDLYAEAMAGTDVEYALRVEMGFNGTDSLGREYHQAAQPYARPAFDERQGDAIQETADALRAIVLGSAT